MTALLVAIPLVSTAAAFACGGLVAANGTVRLLRTSTLAAYHDGIEHYITAFQFAGGEADVGSIVPLPAVPLKVRRGGDWTLQRLARETQPSPVVSGATEGTATSLSGDVEVVYETRIDALDITILKGGGHAVGAWAQEHGYVLPPDSPEVLEFYARRSPVFMAARFDAAAARERGQQVGDGTPIHLTMRTPNPWVPLRILGLGRPASERVEADVYVLTDRRPALLAGRRAGLFVGYDARASKQLLDDLRSDKGMRWVPRRMWLTFMRLDEAAGKLAYDLAIDASGKRRPSLVDAGLVRLRPAKGVVPPVKRQPSLAPELGRASAVSAPRARSDARTGAVGVASGALAAVATMFAVSVLSRSRRSGASTGRF